MTLSRDWLLEPYRLAQECPLEEFRERTLSSLNRQLAFDIARWGSTVIKPSGLSQHCAALYNEDPESLPAYESIKAEDRMVIAQRSVHGYGAFRLHGAVHYSGDAYRGIRDYQRRFLHENSLVAFHNRATGRRTDYVSLYRADQGEQFGEEDERAIRYLLPHLFEALRINVILNAPRLAPPETCGSCLGIADRQRAIVFAEARTRAILVEAWPESAKGRLPSSLFDALVSEGHHRDDCVCVAARPAGDFLFFRVRARCLADSLSPRELDIAKAMARGATCKIAARELGLSPETVRSYLKCIHAKLGVQNRAQLLAELARIGTA